MTLHERILPVALAAAAGGLILVSSAEAIEFTDFAEYGGSVNGYQDDFNGTTLNPDWLVYGGDPTSFTQDGDGTLHITSTGGGAADDPNKLLYNPATPYSNSTQNILMLIKVNTETSADGFRVGTAAASDTTDGQGIDLLFRDSDPNGNFEHFNLLNDAIAWGPSVAVGFQTGTYYWLREYYSPNSDANGDDVYAKTWLAGSGEPADYQISWNYNGGDSSNTTNLRLGLAGITGGSLGDVVDASIDYVLIQADGLPTIAVVPEPGAASFLACGLGTLAFRFRRSGAKPASASAP